MFVNGVIFVISFKVSMRYFYREPASYLQFVCIVAPFESLLVPVRKEYTAHHVHLGGGFYSLFVSIFPRWIVKERSIYTTSFPTC